MKNINISEEFKDRYSELVQNLLDNSELELNEIVELAKSIYEDFNKMMTEKSVRSFEVLLPERYINNDDLDENAIYEFTNKFASILVDERERIELELLFNR